MSKSHHQMRAFTTDSVEPLEMLELNAKLPNLYLLVEGLYAHLPGRWLVITFRKTQKDYAPEGICPLSTRRE